jgi:hypothetical protein
MFKKSIDQKFTESKWKKKEIINLSSHKPKIEKLPTTLGSLKSCVSLNLEDNRIDRLPGILLFSLLQTTKTQKHKNTKTQKHKNTKTQKHKNTKTQKHK